MLLLIWLYVPQSGSATPRPIDGLGFLLMTSGSGGLQMVLSPGSQDDWFSSHFIAGTNLMALLALTFFVWCCFEISHPIAKLRLLKDRALALGSAGIGIFGLALYGVMVILSIYLKITRATRR